MPEEDRFERVIERVQRTLGEYPYLNEVVGSHLAQRVRENRQKYHATRNILFHMLLSAGEVSFAGGKEEVAQLEDALRQMEVTRFSPQSLGSIRDGLLSHLEAEQTTTIATILAMSYLKGRGYEVVFNGEPVFEAHRDGRRLHIVAYALPASPYMEERLIDPDEEPPADVLAETTPWLTERLLELDKTPCTDRATAAIFIQIFDNLTGDVKRDDRIMEEATTSYFSGGGRAGVIIYFHFLLKNAVELYRVPQVPRL